MRKLLCIMIVIIAGISALKSPEKAIHDPIVNRKQIHPTYIYMTDVQYQIYRGDQMMVRLGLTRLLFGMVVDADGNISCKGGCG